jgi:purine-binding chemotaxis protein CheW
MSATSGRAQVPAAGDSPRKEGRVVQLVGFRLGDEDYAIAITKIQEIILMKPITRIPEVPTFIEGLINLRGVVIPIINLRKRFGMPARDQDEETRTIVVNVNDKTIGCVVDAVTRVMRLNEDQIQDAPTTFSAVSQRYISGLAKLDDRLLIVLDVEKLFEPSDLAVPTEP